MSSPDLPPGQRIILKKEEPANDSVHSQPWTGRGEPPPVKDPVQEPEAPQQMAQEREVRDTRSAPEVVEAEAIRNNEQRAADYEAKREPAVPEPTPEPETRPEPKVYYASSWGAPGPEDPSKVSQHALEDKSAAMSGPINEKTRETDGKVEPKIPGIENVKLAPKKETVPTEKQAAKSIDGIVPSLADHFAAVTGSAESTPKEKKDASLSFLKSLVEKASGKVGHVSGKIGETFEGVPGSVSEGFKKGAAYCAARTKVLGKKLKEFGIGELKGTVEDAKKLGNVVLDAISNPEQVAHNIAEKAKRMNAYRKYFRDAEVSNKEKAKKFGMDMLSLAEAYRKAPFRRKALLSLGLIGSSFALGGAGTLAVSIFAAGKYGTRALSALGLYTALEAAGEEKLSQNEIESQEIRSRFDSWKKHGIAAGSAMIIASGVPGALIRDLFIGGEEGVSYLYHAMSGASAPTSLTPAEGWALSHGHTLAPSVETESGSSNYVFGGRADSSFDHAMSGTPAESLTPEGASGIGTHPAHTAVSVGESAAHAADTAPAPVEVTPVHAPIEATITKSGQGVDRLFEQLQAKLRAEGFSAENPPPFAKDIFKSPDTLSMQYGLEARDGSSSFVVHMGDSLVLKDGHYALHTASGERILSEGTLPRAETVTSKAPIPEARPEHVFPPAQTVEAPPSVHEVSPVTPESASSNATIETPAPDTTHNFSGRTGEQLPYGKDAGAGAHIPLQNAVDSHDVSPPGETPDAPQQHVSSPESQPTNSVESGHLEVNPHGVAVDAEHAHQYLGKEGEKIVFGGNSNDDRVARAIAWVSKDHKAEVYFETTTYGRFGQVLHHLMRATWAELTSQAAGPTGAPVGPELPVDKVKIEEITLPNVRTPSINDLYKAAD